MGGNPILIIFLIMVAFFLLMDFKFAGTSPGNSAENYSAAVTDGYIDGPLLLRRTVVCIRRPGTFFCYVEIRAHTMEPTKVRHNCDGPSSGNRRVINELYPTGPFFKIRLFKPPPSNPSFHPIPSLFLSSPLSFQLPHSLNHRSLPSHNSPNL